MLLVNGKRKDGQPKMVKVSEFELVSGFSMENTRTRDAKGNPTIKKNLRFQIPAVYVKFDEGLNQNVEYRYAVREIPIQTGKDAGTKKYAPDKVAFIGSKLIVTQEHPDLYEWLINSPYIDNGKNKNPKFVEINPAGKAKSRIEREALRNKAMRLVVDEDALPELTLRRILSSTGDNGDAYDISIVREKLMNLVESNPADFLKMIGTRDVELKALINDVSTKKFITFDTVKSEWQWGEKTKEVGNKILSVPRGKNEIDWMIDTLLRDEALMKSFKILNGKNADSPEVSSEREALVVKLKALKISIGYVKMTDEKIKERLEKEINRLKSELSKPNIGAFDKADIEEKLASIGELQLT